MGRLTPWLLLALLGLAVAEVGMHVRARAQVPSEGEQRAAAAFVREHFSTTEVITAAPAWLDPVVREQLGDLIGLEVAGRSDLARFSGLWVWSIRGAVSPEELAFEPDLERSFGRVTLRHYRFEPEPITYDFVAQVGAARVEQSRGPGKSPSPCKRANRVGAGGALGQAVVAPRGRAQCRKGGYRGFVAPVLLEDLDQHPRPCVWQPALDSHPLRVTFEDVPLGQRIVLHGGLYYEDERMRRGAPVGLKVWVDGKLRGELTHRDGDGWMRAEFPSGGGRGQVRFEVHSEQPERRGFCWEATARGGAVR